MVAALEQHPLFERVSDDSHASDGVVPLLYNSTEEGKKVGCAETLMLSLLSGALDPLSARRSRCTQSHPPQPAITRFTPSHKKPFPCLQVYRNKLLGQNHGDGDVRLAVYRRLSDPAPLPFE